MLAYRPDEIPGRRSRYEKPVELDLKRMGESFVLDMIDSLFPHSKIVQPVSDEHHIIFPRIMSALKMGLRTGTHDMQCLHVLDYVFQGSRASWFCESFVASGGLIAFRDILNSNHVKYFSSINATLKVLISFSKVSLECKRDIIQTGFIGTLTDLCLRSDFESMHHLSVYLLNDLATCPQSVFLTSDAFSSNVDGISGAILKFLYNSRPEIVRLAVQLGISVWNNETALACVLSEGSGKWLLQLHPQLCRILLSKQEALECKYEVAPTQMQQFFLLTLLCRLRNGYCFCIITWK